MQKRIIGYAHDRGRFATIKTKELICRAYFIPNLEDKIKKYILHFVKSKKRQARRITTPNTYHIDFLGPLESTHKEYKHILAVIDSFTKFCWLYPTKSTTATEVFTKLSSQSTVFGNPTFIISDRGSSFTSQDFVKYCSEEGINLVKTTTGLSRVNSQVEWLN